MLEINLSVPEEMALKVEPENLASELKLAAAIIIKLYEIGKISSGAAAMLAGIPKTVFPGKLADYGIPSFRMTGKELMEDMKNA